jgi:hypothetical protein
LAHPGHPNWIFPGSARPSRPPPSANDFNPIIIGVVLDVAGDAGIRGDDEIWPSGFINPGVLDQFLNILEGQTLLVFGVADGAFVPAVSNEVTL